MNRIKFVHKINTRGAKKGHKVVLVKFDFLLPFLPETLLVILSCCFLNVKGFKLFKEAFAINLLFKFFSYLVVCLIVKRFAQKKTCKYVFINVFLSQMFFEPIDFSC